MFTNLRVRGYRSIADSGDVPLGRITVVVGRNNSGKSALVRAPYLFQDQSVWQASDHRIGATTTNIELYFTEIPTQLRTQKPKWKGPGRLSVEIRTNNRTLKVDMLDDVGKAENSVGVTIPNREPGNLFIPILSGRRQPYYREQISDDHSRVVSAVDSYLPSRMLRLTSSDIPEAVKFRRLCKEVLGIKLDIIAGENVQQIGSQVDIQNAILLEAMGSGLSGVLSLLAALSTANDKLFIIEEPENDLHPMALKALLDAIMASESNQFLISTHSSTVLTRLGASQETTVVHVESDGELLPTSTYKVITERSERMKVLQDLGYTLADMDLSLGWLIFEESSAERLVKQYLIRWFAPGLEGLRTVAACGTGRVKSLFNNFREMLLYAHLEPMYHSRAWVIVDGDKEGVELTESLASKFTDWDPTHFLHWQKSAFEYYYPAEFKEAVESAFSISDRRKRQDAKEELLLRVVSWIEEDEERARASFETSSSEAIKVLRNIERQLKQL